MQWHRNQSDIMPVHNFYAPLHNLSKLYDVPVGFVSPAFEAVHCYISDRRRVAVARYQIICLVLGLDLLTKFLRFPCSISDGCRLLTGITYFPGHVVSSYINMFYLSHLKAGRDEPDFELGRAIGMSILLNNKRFPVHCISHLSYRQPSHQHQQLVTLLCDWTFKSPRATVNTNTDPRRKTIQGSLFVVK